MKIYHYNELKKANQALGSFKRNSIEVVNVKICTIKDKVNFYIVTSPHYKSKREKKNKKVKEKKVEKKSKKQKKENKEEKIKKGKKNKND